ncbi:hypothetical protein ISCGN_021310 [Ixodes scapularis]
MMDRAGDLASGLSRRPYERRVVVCNCASYCYFSLAIVLFSLGTVLTILVLDDSEKVFPNLTHMWLIGPIFISSGLMFAVKTIMYLRRETMLAYISRQHSLLRWGRTEHECRIAAASLRNGRWSVSCLSPIGGKQSGAESGTGSYAAIGRAGTALIRGGHSSLQRAAACCCKITGFNIQRLRNAYPSRQIAPL